MRPLTLIALLAAVAIPVAGCGDDEDSGDSGGNGNGGSVYGGGGGTDTGSGEETEAGSGGGAQTLRISADPGGALAFDKESLTATAGKVTIVMDNPSDLPHAVEIEGSGVEVAGETVMKGGVSRASAELQAGEYEYYCPVGNHQSAGMTGTLTVN